MMELASQELRALVTSTHERGEDLATNGPTRSHVSLGEDIKALSLSLDNFAANVDADDTIVLATRSQIDAQRAQYETERAAMFQLLVAALGSGFEAVLEAEVLGARVTEITARLQSSEANVAALNELFAAIPTKKSKKSAAKKSAKR